MQSRRTILPKRLAAPGPDTAQLQQILVAAASAPDHGQVRPWRFVMVPDGARAALAQTFGDALLERDPQAGPEHVLQAQEKAHRSPCLMLVVVRTDCGDPDIDLPERLISTGCAVQNILLVATALGYGSALTSGKALKSHVLRALFGLLGGEHALCFISLGTVQSRKLSPRQRPVPEDYVSTLVVS
ncbi:nitroreductase [Rhodoferax sp. AJA081-3]|uniref:nitroreductase family protein n=1 Tax=Rhodoferax sp. AJA081-3 TaxID=2752316 RepID=UPI001AE07CA7|nr:nitroreductase [Rhodoferax sp. AJA081-3]QTN30701.1 nitroreductase [Rhodoferax sp. AJA081-3]